MMDIQELFGIMIFFTAAMGVRIKEKRSQGTYEQRSGTAQHFAEKYPLCSKKLLDQGMELRDLLLTEEEVAKLFAPQSNCSWWESSACQKAYAVDLSNNYFFRMTLVGQPDPRGPTLYTPQAQMAVIEQMRETTTSMLKRGRRVPDIPFMEGIFKGINVEDTGSLMVDIMNAFAAVFNRGSKDTLYRSKDVTTRPYDLTKWGDDMLRKIQENNPLTYTNNMGQVTKALDIKAWGFPMSGEHSFIYKFPPRGIKHELQRILDGFAEKSNLVKDVSNLVVFELAEKWIRDIVILHPFTDSNGRSARVSLNVLLMLNGLAPIVMARQDEDMTSTPEELRDRICEGMAYARNILRGLPDLRGEIVNWRASGSASPLAPRCCSAKSKLERDTEWCVSVPANLGCATYSNLTQSARYMEWNDGDTCNIALQDPGLCPRGADKKRLKNDVHFLLDRVLNLRDCSTIPTFRRDCDASTSPGACYTPEGSNHSKWQCWNYEQASSTMSDKSCKKVPGMAGACRFQNHEETLYKCETVPTYDPANAAVSCSQHKKNIACFSLRKGVTWQCYDKGTRRRRKGTNPTCSTNLIPANEQIGTKVETYYGACVHEQNPNHSSAESAATLVLPEASIAGAPTPITQAPITKTPTKKAPTTHTPTTLPEASAARVPGPVTETSTEQVPAARTSAPAVTPRVRGAQAPTKNLITQPSSTQTLTTQSDTVNASDKQILNLQNQISQSPTTQVTPEIMPIKSTAITCQLGAFASVIFFWLSFASSE